jgi:hypothetical protein
VHKVTLLKSCQRADNGRQSADAGLLTHRMSLDVSINQLARLRVNGQGARAEYHPIGNDGLGVDAHSGRRSFIRKDGSFDRHYSRSKVSIYREKGNETKREE